MNFALGFRLHASIQLKEGFIIEDNQLYKVLVVCTGNICRSPMAAGLLNHNLPAHLASAIEVASAGTHALHGHQAHDFAVEAMARLGIDISAHRARMITREIARSADLILVMEQAHGAMVRKLLPWGADKPRMISAFDPESAEEDIRDPFGDPLEAYQECIRTLIPCIQGVRTHLANTLLDAGDKD